MQGMTLRRLPLRTAIVVLLAVGMLTHAWAQTPPRIMEAPADATTNVGGAASFRVVVAAESTVRYQWYRDEQPLADATGAVLVLPRVTSADAGRYRVDVRVAEATIPGGAATLTVTPPSATPIVDSTFRGDAALDGTPTLLLPLADGRVLLATRGNGVSTAQAELRRLLPGGGIDPAFRVGVATAEEFPKRVNDAIVQPESPVIRQVLVQPDGALIVLGNFAFFNGVARGGIARVRSDGTLDTQFAPQLTAYNLSSLSMSSTETIAALQPDGKILVIERLASNAIRVVRLEADGRRDATFTPFGDQASPTALVRTRAGRIVVAYGVSSLTRATSGRIGALLANGATDPTFATQVCPPVQRLYALDDGRVVATTHYDTGVVVRPGLPNNGPRFPATTFRLRVDGSPDSEFAQRASLLLTPPTPEGTLFLEGKIIAPDGSETTPNPGVASTAITSSHLYTLDASRRLWVAGPFSFFNGVTSSRVARLNVVSRENLTAPRVLAAWAEAPVVRYGEGVVFRVAPVGDGPLTYTWLRASGDVVEAVTNEPQLKVTGTVTDTTTYRVRVANSSGAAALETITVTNQPPELKIAWQPRRIVLTPGRLGAISLQLAPGVLTNYSEWRRDGALLSFGATGRVGSIRHVDATNLEFSPVEPANAGTYTVTLRDRAGERITSEPIKVVVGGVSRFTNLSVRAEVGPGDQAAVIGFVIPPGQSRQLIVRGIGPGLAGFGIAGVLPDPRLDLFDGDGRALYRNNDWLTTFSTNEGFARVGAFALGGGSRDTALNVELRPGSYTARLASLGNTAGVGLIELYENDNDSDRLINVSARVTVRGDALGAAVAGFTIRGPVGKRVLVRAAGPALAAFGVARPLGDPQIEIRVAQGGLVAANDDWQAQPQAPQIAAAASSVGAFPLAAGSTDAALLLTLAPGDYTAVVSGKTSATGTALIEVYELP